MLAALFASPNIGNRFIDEFIEQLPSHNESPYFRVMNSGMVVFETAPVLGVGTANYRILCADLTRDHTDVDCHTHPHNYYIQLLAETGIIGLVLGCIMLGAIIWSCAQTSIKGRADVVMATAVIIPLGLFFPLQSTADFFGQWNNIFMWSAMALALSSGNLMAKKAQIC